MEDSSTPALTTRTVGIRFGMIFGVISIVYFLIFVLADLDMSQGLGRWGTTIISFVIVFLAHKYYKENGDGFMSYGQGIGIGFWTGMVASVVSSIFTYIYLKFIDDSFLTTIRDKAVEEMQAKGQSEEQIEMAMKFMTMFTNPEAMLVMGIVMGIITLVVVSLIISIFTQKPRPEQIG
ncbi:MAG: DUF4199 domain-containing protein [Chryseolinea sp.]